MSRVQPRSMPDERRMVLLDLLWTSIAELTSRDEVKAFFKDLLSETEAIMLARRIRIAQLLLQNCSYDEIQRLLKTSRPTIANVQRWLTSGFHGYEPALKRFNEVTKERQRQLVKKLEQKEPYSFEWLKSHYPVHFLLFNLMEDAQTQYRKKRRRKLK